MERKPAGKAPPKRKRGGGSLARSETLTVRLDPRLRYLAELAARQQRRSLSSLVEWSVESALSMVEVTKGVSIASKASELWALEESERFIALAWTFPDLLDYEQQMMWAIIRRQPFFWSDLRQGEDVPAETKWTASRNKLINYRVRYCWDRLLSVVRGEKSETEAIPRPPKSEIKPVDQTEPTEPESDIPF